jgi:hypothetical protein
MPITGSVSISINTATTTDVIAAIAGRRHRIMGIILQAAGTVNITLKSIIAGTETINLSGPMPQAANTGFGREGNGTRPIFNLAKGAKFSITTDQAVQVSGWVEYDTAPA